MKKVRILGFTALSAALLASCATVKSPVTGLIYTNVKSGMAVTDNAGMAKKGSAKATSILGIIATGDASISTAAKAGGITKIHHVDEHATSILGIYSKYEITVYGE